MHVPFYRLRLSAAELKAVAAVLRSGWLTTGERTRTFEKEFASYVGSPHAVAVNSCTAALHLSLLSAGVRKGDRVITTPYTFVSTIEAILLAGAEPVFVDTERDSLNIDLELAAAAVSLTTSALVPVHIAGLPCDLDRLEAIRRATRLAIVHDAAHALGAAWKTRKVGSTRDFSCFSFYATKNLTTGEGGMITTSSKRAAERLRRLSLHGMSRGAWRRYAATGGWRYKVDDFGYKYNISDIASALGLAQLRRFEQMQRKRTELAEFYRESLSGIEELTLPRVSAKAQHAWHLYIVRLDASHSRYRDRIIRALRERSVETSVHFIPVYLHNYYRERFKLNYRDYPNSYRHYQSVISLPFFVDLREREIRHVASSLKSIIASLKRKGS